jgi:hypothetical protein
MKAIHEMMEDKRDTAMNNAQEAMKAYRNK